MLTDRILRQAFPKMTAATREMVLAHAPAAMEQFNITGSRRVSAFLAQCAHESAMFTARRENLNYSAEGLMHTWPKRFTSIRTAKRYERKPNAIANRVYSLRMGNGDEASGDPARWIGRGFIQLTGRNNYTDFAKALGMPLDDVPAYLGTDVGAFMSAAWFWSINGLNELADGWQITAISAKVNGKNPAHGLAERVKFSNSLLREQRAA